MEQQRNSSGAMVAAVLLLLPFVYLATYLALVDPRGVMYPGSNKPMTGPDGIAYFALPTYHNYRYGGPISEKLFWPLEQIDQRVFPERWLDQVRQPQSGVIFEIYDPLTKTTQLWGQPELPP
jgi:hypothetical protein